MKKITNILLPLLFTFLLGCLTEDTGGGTQTESGEMIRFHFTLEGNNLQTKSIPAEEGENNINDLYLLFFKPSSGATGKYLGFYEVPEVDIPNITENDADIKFNVNVRLTHLSKSEGYNILAIANTEDNFNIARYNDISTMLDQLGDMTEKEVIDLVITRIDNEETRAGEYIIFQNDNLMMSGRAVKQASVDEVNCRLIRVVSRFDVSNKASGYTLTSVSIWNAYTHGAVWDNAEFNTGTRTKRYYGIDNINVAANDPEINGAFYAFENICTDPDQNDAKTTCLIFGIKPDAGSTTYYRVNIHPELTGQYLKRNNVYQVIIEGINGAGEASEQEAYEKGKTLLDFSINAWDRDEDGLILREGDNLLAIPTRRAVFTPEEEERKYFIFTQGGDRYSLELHEIFMSTGMSARLEGNNLYIKVSSHPTSEARTGKIELRFAGMTGTIDIIQTGEKAKYLSLSPTQLLTWPASALPPGIPGGEPIRVKSSGDWTAEIYGGGFAFVEGSPTDVTTAGSDGDEIYIYALEANSDEEDKLAFILVSLNDDPDHYRSAVVLTQAGAGSFYINPTNTEIYFEADGTPTQGSQGNNTFTVQTVDAWKVELTDGNTDKFEIHYADGTDPDQEGAISGNGTFTIAAKGDNFDHDTYAIFHITQNGVKRKEIRVFQGYYGLHVTPTLITSINAEGGDAVIWVESPYTNGTFSAYIESNLKPEWGLIPVLIGTDKIESDKITGQPVGQPFTIKMPGINRELDENPIATITVTLDQATNLTEEVIVKQNGVEYSPIYAITLKDGHGGWTSYLDYFNVWVDIMKAHGIENYLRNASNTNIKPGTRIIGINNIGDAALPILNNKNTPFPFESMKEDQYTVFVVSAHDLARCFTPLGLETDFPYSYSTKTERTNPRKINQGAINMNEPLYNYLMKGVNPDNISLKPHDTLYSYLTNHPNTFVPLIVDPNRPEDVLFGIDPNNRIIWVGDTELFSNKLDNTTGNYPVGSDSYIFLENVISWMVNVNKYGDAFNKQFIK